MTDLCIKCLKSEITESGSNYGQFLLDSLSPGQGITIGTLLRRILLGNLGGTAVTAVRIAGATHEFSTLEGVREDILEILLNLKGIVFKNNTQDLKLGRLKIQGPAVITADCLQLPSGLEIVNPNHYIATISTTNILEMELQFEYGTGYKLAGQKMQENSVDFLEVDAIFMPVQKVDFKVETPYANKNQNNENLILDIWTNGSITPEEAIFQSSQLIINLFEQLLENKSNTDIEFEDLETSPISTETHMNISIEELQLSVRAYNCLKRAQINSISDLLKYSPEKLQEIKNFGQKSADEVFDALKNKLGITLS
uniref:DNA-directed RNA polymerase subunit alpha n=1 Tax=Triparma laevis TaxID=1534972 RepID=A0A0K2RWF9_9STRA|nr:DNA-directed RNA polymerase subunit alpha [Triparma laevis]BAS19125.1 DNA-directed RNA polymerase subunit alpha [Triparma laevis]